MADRIIGDYTAAITIDGSTDYLLIQPTDSSTQYKKINRNVLLGVSGQPADISTVQAITNKTLDNTNTITIKDSLLTLQDNLDTTKQAQFQLSGITTATTRTYTLPNASSTLADIATAQTFTNKTLTAPVINGGTIDNSTITVDAIGEHTVANGVTIDGLNIKDGALNTNNSVVANSITDGAVTPAKLVAGTGSGWTWASWTPTWANLTIGNATVTGLYIQMGKTVFFRLQVVFGNTTSMGTSPTFTLPITAATYAGTFKPVITTTVQLVDTGSALYAGYGFMSSTTICALAQYAASGTPLQAGVAITATAPFTWTNADEIAIQGFYEAA